MGLIWGELGCFFSVSPLSWTVSFLITHLELITWTRGFLSTLHIAAAAAVKTTKKNTLGRSIKSIFESSFGKPAPGVLSIQGLETGPCSNSYLLTFTNKATACHFGSIGEVKCHSTRKHPEHLIMSLIRAAHEIRCCQAPETCIPCLQQDHVWWAAVRRR